MAKTIEETLERLKQSDFRRKFHLTLRDKKYVYAKGLEIMREHAETFVKLRLAPAFIPNDGKQTPTKGHPIFVAQHACACCCRGCLNKWYNIPKEVELTPAQQEKIVNLLMAWIKEEMVNYQEG